MIVHETKIRIPYVDVDQMGYVYHSHYVEYFDMARTEMIRSVGIPNRKLEEIGYMLPVIEVHIDYGLPVFCDDEITVRTILKELTRGATATFHYEIYRGEEKILTGHVKIVFVHRDTRKPCRMPQVLYDKLLPYFK